MREEGRKSDYEVTKPDYGVTIGSDWIRLSFLQGNQDEILKAYYHVSPAFETYFLYKYWHGLPSTRLFSDLAAYAQVMRKELLTPGLVAKSRRSFLIDEILECLWGDPEQLLGLSRAEFSRNFMIVKEYSQELEQMLKETRSDWMAHLGDVWREVQTAPEEVLKHPEYLSLLNYHDHYLDPIFSESDHNLAVSISHMNRNANLHESQGLLVIGESDLPSVRYFTHSWNRFLEEMLRVKKVKSHLRAYEVWFRSRHAFVGNDDWYHIVGKVLSFLFNKNFDIITETLLEAKRPYVKSDESKVDTAEALARAQDWILRVIFMKRKLLPVYGSGGDVVDLSSVSAQRPLKFAKNLVAFVGFEDAELSTFLPYGEIELSRHSDWKEATGR